MKTALTILTTCLVLLTAGTLARLVWQHQLSLELARVNQQLSLELQASEKQVAALTTEKAIAAGKMSELETSEQELRNRVDSLEKAAQAAAEVAPQPYRVRAYLGQDNVGGAWIIPHNVTRDTESGRYLYEPVLVIDTSAKRYFTEHHTNVVEREVYTTEVYDNYYPYYYYLGAGRHPGTNRPHMSPQAASRPAMSAGLPPQQPSARAQLFAPPMSIVNSRPQVLGRPATSPINAAIFAP